MQNRPTVNNNGSEARDPTDNNRGPFPKSKSEHKLGLPSSAENKSSWVKNVTGKEQNSADEKLHDGAGSSEDLMTRDKEPPAF